MARAVAVVNSRSKTQDGIWLNRFWTNRHPTPEVLDKIAETLGGDLTFFDDNPRTVIEANFALVALSKGFEVEAHAAIHEAVRLGTQEAPQREIDRRKTKDKENTAGARKGAASQQAELPFVKCSCKQANRVLSMVATGK